MTARSRLLLAAVAAAIAAGALAGCAEAPALGSPGGRSGATSASLGATGGIPLATGVPSSAAPTPEPTPAVSSTPDGADGAAHPHVAVELTYPSDGDQLEAPPAKVLVSFYEPLSPLATVVVTAPDGTQVQQGEAVADGMLLSEPLAASAQPGTYSVAWRVLTKAGHPAEGQFFFSVGSVDTRAAG